MGHCRIRANNSVRGQDHLLSEDVTVAEVLKGAGYGTGFIGKWGIGLPGTEGAPDKQGFDFSYGYYDQARAHGFFPHYLMRNGKPDPIPENYGFNMNRVKTYNSRPIDRLEDVKNIYDENGRPCVLKASRMRMQQNISRTLPEGGPSFHIGAQRQSFLPLLRNPTSPRPVYHPTLEPTKTSLGA